MNFKRIVLLGIVVHLVASIFSAGYYHVDEHFQIMEFTAMKLGLTPPEGLAWEYDHRMRPAFQPALAYAVIKVFQFFSLDNPFYEAVFLRMLSAFLGLACMVLLLFLFLKEIKQERLKRWAVFLSFFLWFLVYQHVRFSSETWSGTVFFLGLGWYLYSRDKQVLSVFKMFLAGLILGLAFVIRFQTGFMIAGFLFWLLLVKKEKFINLAGLVLGLMAAFLAGILLDRWFYGQWTLTAWNYLNLNIIQDKVSGYGIKPWWYYISITFIDAVPPYSLLLVAAFFLIWFFYPWHVLSWIIFPFLLIHTLIGHKEIRFLFPLANLIPVVVALFLQKFMETERLAKIRGFFRRFPWKWLPVSFWAINLLLLTVICFKPADGMIYFYKFMYDRNYTRLYFMGKHPYRSVGTICKHFYKRKGLDTIEVKDLTELKKVLRKSGEDVLFMGYSFDLARKLSQEGLKHTLLFRNLPEWSVHFNINNWLSRTKVASVYRIHSLKGQPE
ncbi:MAG: hypothetical protein PHF84_03555 [bacterium]|nr:hypothetical protein [bacterium]